MLLYHIVTGYKSGYKYNYNKNKIIILHFNLRQSVLNILVILNKITSLIDYIIIDKISSKSV